MENKVNTNNIKKLSFEFKASGVETGFVFNYLRSFFIKITINSNDFGIFFSLIQSQILSVQNTELCNGHNKRVPFKIGAFNRNSNVFVAISSR